MNTTIERSVGRPPGTKNGGSRHGRPVGSTSGLRKGRAYQISRMLPGDRLLIEVPDGRTMASMMTENAQYILRADMGNRVRQIGAMLIQLRERTTREVIVLECTS